MDANLIVLGLVWTGDGRTAGGLAVGGGRILVVGSEAQAERHRGKGTRVWRLPPGRVVLPGFVDSHAHLAADAWRRTWVDLGDSRSLEEALGRIRARTRATPRGAWVVARGWDESVWPERRYLTRRDLDGVSRRHPIVANRVDGHLCTANSLAIRRSRLTATDEGVALDGAGQMTGVLAEGAATRARAAIPRPSEEEWSRLLEAAIGGMHRLGVTSVHDVVGALHLAAYQRLRRGGRLRIRAYLLPYDDLLPGLVGSGLRTGFGDAWLRLGAIKVFADGSLGARTAALHRAYADGPGRGGLLHRPRELRALVAQAHGAGFQLAVHAIGDRGIDAVVDALGRALDRDPREDHRHRIEHAELPSEETLGRLSDLSLVPSMQPNFVRRWSFPGGLYEQRLGRGRLEGNNPYRDIRRRGLPLAFGSDGMPYGPLYGLGGAVEAPFPSQRLRPAEAIRGYTAAGAFASFEEGEKGVLTAGALADFVVLSGAPGVVPLAAIAVEATVVGGRVVHGSRPRFRGKRS